MGLLVGIGKEVEFATAEEALKGELTNKAMSPATTKVVVDEAVKELKYIELTGTEEAPIDVTTLEVGSYWLNGVIAELPPAYNDESKDYTDSLRQNFPEFAALATNLVYAKVSKVSNPENPDEWSKTIVLGADFAAENEYYGGCLVVFHNSYSSYCCVSGRMYTQYVSRKNESDKQELSAQIKAESTRAQQAEQNLATDIQSEAQRAKQEEQILSNGKVDKETGKGLSANDFTDEYLAKVASLATTYLQIQSDTTQLIDSDITFDRGNQILGRKANGNHATMARYAIYVTGNEFSGSKTVFGVRFSSEEILSDASVISFIATNRAVISNDGVYFYHNGTTWATFVPTTVTEQLEVGSESEHLNLNALENVTIDTPSGKEEFLFDRVVSQSEFAALPDAIKNSPYHSFSIYADE